MSFAELENNVLKNDLCMSCGACYIACPHDFIKLDQIGKPSFEGPDLDACEGCNACIESCPGLDPETQKSEKFLFGRSRSENERWVGIYQQSFGGFSNNPEIFEKSASGGLTTTLLGAAMNYYDLDHVLVAGRNPDQPWKGYPMVCDNETEMISAAQSTYQLFPYLWILKDLLKADPNKKIGMVGLACHIQALRKLQRIDNVWGELMRSQIKFTAEIACSSNTLASGTETLITDKLNIQLEDVADVKFRQGNYPGDFTVFTKNGEHASIPFHESIKHFVGHKCHRCLSCGDWMSGLADISLCDGDPNLFRASKNSEDGNKFGTLFVRTEVGKELVEFAQKEELISSWNLPLFDESKSLGLQRKRNRRADYEEDSKLILPKGPIDNFIEGIDIIPDEQLIDNMSN